MTILQCSFTITYKYCPLYQNASGFALASVHPMASKFPGISSYAYCYNNPVNFVDPDGMETIDYQDEWEIDTEGNVTRTGGEGGAETQYINYVDEDGNRGMATQEIDGAGFSVNDDNRATKDLNGRLWHDYNSKESDMNNIAMSSNTSTADNQDEEQPLIKFEARTNVGLGIESKVKFLGQGGHFKIGASKNVTNAVYSEDGVDTYWGGDNILSSSGGLFLFSLGGNYNLAENELYSSGNFGPLQGTIKKSSENFRFSIFEVNTQFLVGGKLKFSISPELLNRKK